MIETNHTPDALTSEEKLTSLNGEFGASFRLNAFEIAKSQQAHRIQFPNPYKSIIREVIQGMNLLMPLKFKIDDDNYAPTALINKIDLAKDHNSISLPKLYPVQEGSTYDEAIAFFYSFVSHKVFSLADLYFAVAFLMAYKVKKPRGIKTLKYLAFAGTSVGKEHAPKIRNIHVLDLVHENAPLLRPRPIDSLIGTDSALVFL